VKSEGEGKVDKSLIQKRHECGNEEERFVDDFIKKRNGIEDVIHRVLVGSGVLNTPNCCSWAEGLSTCWTIC
jgi:hypothetical protein